MIGCSFFFERFREIWPFAWGVRECYCCLWLLDLDRFGVVLLYIKWRLGGLLLDFKRRLRWLALDLKRWLGDRSLDVDIDRGFFITHLLLGVNNCLTLIVNNLLLAGFEDLVDNMTLNNLFKLIYCWGVLIKHRLLLHWKVFHRVLHCSDFLH